MLMMCYLMLAESLVELFAQSVLGRLRSPMSQVGTFGWVEMMVVNKLHRLSTLWISLFGGL